MPYLDRGGVRIYYEDHGRGLPVLLTHGFGASARMWKPQADALADRFRLILWDMRGHDRSDSPREPDAYSHELAIGDMAGVLDACGVERAVVGGLSLGGFLSLAFHLRHRERVLALLLCDTGPGYKNADARGRWNRWAEERAAEYEQRGPAAGTNSPEVLSARHVDGRGVALAARGILTQHDARVIESLPTIAVPTLLVVGSRDDAFLGPADYMAAKIPGAAKVVIEGAGHAPNIECAADFNAQVASFLDRVERSIG